MIKGYDHSEIVEWKIQTLVLYTLLSLSADVSNYSCYQIIVNPF